MKKLIIQKGNVQKANLAAPSPRADTGGQMKKLSTPTPLATSSIKDEFFSLREAASAVQRIRQSAQHELELARKMRADAQRYQQETATKARSEAQQLILRTRLATQREIEELIRQAGEETQKLLADIRMIRITAQEELAAVSKFTDAAKLSSMSLTIKGNHKKPEGKKKQLAAVK
ncbi:MAG: hypothetical protein KAW90_01485 [Dehalococcoidales bacterium]|nr:hypothetical protein [Dehalococcoidales bacterium]